MSAMTVAIAAYVFVAFCMFATLDGESYLRAMFLAVFWPAPLLIAIFNKILY